MKLFTLLATVACAEAALTPAQEKAAQKAFHKWDSNNEGDLTSGGVYGALAQLDKHLTEEQLQKAAGHKKKVDLEKFMKIYANVEGKGTSSSGGKFPKGCQNWFDGCNHCIIKDGKEVGCTKMFCGQMYDGPKKKPFCTVFEDGRRCKSATSCKGSKSYNCFTREVWSADKKKWCCKTKKMGCPQENQKKTLKAGEVCYAFDESNADAAVNRKKDCPKGYKCAPQQSDFASFNSLMTCQKSSKAEGPKIPAGCTSWYDGCNTCMVQNGKIGGCTKRACFRQGKSKCTRYGGDDIVRVVD